MFFDNQFKREKSKQSAHLLKGKKHISYKYLLLVGLQFKKWIEVFLIESFVSYTSTDATDHLVVWGSLDHVRKLMHATYLLLPLCYLPQHMTNPRVT